MRYEGYVIWWVDRERNIELGPSTLPFVERVTDVCIDENQRITRIEWLETGQLLTPEHCVAIPETQNEDTDLIQGRYHYFPTETNEPGRQINATTDRTFRLRQIVGTPGEQRIILEGSWQNGDEGHGWWTFVLIGYQPFNVR